MAESTPSSRMIWLLYGIVGTLLVVSCCLVAAIGAVWLRSTPAESTGEMRAPDVTRESATACRDAVSAWADAIAEVTADAGAISDAITDADAEYGILVSQYAYQALDDIEPPACDPELALWQSDLQQVFLTYVRGFEMLADDDVWGAIERFDAANSMLTELNHQLEDVVTRYE